MKHTTIFKQTTEVPVGRSTAGIIDMLAKAKARSVHQEFATNGEVKSIRFAMELDGKIFCFELPARVDAVFKVLKAQKSHRSRATDADLRLQAARIAWRQTYAWVEAQLAIIQTGMVEPDEAFMAYNVNERGQTLFQHWKDQRLLPAPK